jgi:hypothetical protein
MECWNNEKAMGSVKNLFSQLPSFRRRRLFAHASQGRHPIIPIFHHSIIPIQL